MEFDKEDAAAFKNVQKLIDDNSLELNLTFIKANFGNLPKYIFILQISKLLSPNSIYIIVQVQNEIEADNSSIGKVIKKNRYY